MHAEPVIEERHVRKLTPPRKSSSYAIPKWLVWVCGIIMVALLVLAITLPLTNKKNDNKNNDNASDHTCPIPSLIPHYDVFSTDPFDDVAGLTRIGAGGQKLDIDRLRTIWDNLSWTDRLGQISQWSRGDFSGPQIIDDSVESWYKLIDAGGVGAFLNVLSIYDMNKFQKRAKEQGKPPILFAFDVIHGYATIFPVNIGMAAAFDRQMIYDTSAISAKESLHEGIPWTFAPMVDISRDPRWGRMSESAGEDPYLAGELGVQYVKGFQDNGVAACVKHLVAYGAAQAGRDYHTAELSDVTLFNDYLPAYKKALDAGAVSGMASFNTIKGIPAHANREMMIDLIRGVWNYKGLMDSDYGAIRELVNHGVAKDIADAAVLSLTSGVDMAMGDGAFYGFLKNWTERDGHSFDEKMEDGHTLREWVELAAKRILIMKERLGLFDTDGIFPEEGYGTGFRLPEYLEAARVAAEKSAVLLVNKDKTLPIAENSGKVLLVGKLANSVSDQGGNWSGYVRNGTTPGHPVALGVTTPYDAFLEHFHMADDKTKPDDTKFAYTLGYTTTTWTETIEQDDEKAMDETLKAITKDVKYIVYYAGESRDQNGEAASRTNLTLSFNQSTLLHRIKASLKDRTDVKLILVVQSGRPNILSWENDNCDAILQMWSPGSGGGPALYNLLYGKVTPSGKLPVTFPRNEGQIPISYSDLRTGRPYVPVDGVDDGEKFIPTDQYLMIAGSPKFYSRYIDSKTSPLYVFGYGLSYTEFSYAATLTPKSLSAGSNDPITIDVTVTNKHPEIAADEVVQVYVKTRVSKIAPHKKRLRQFDRVSFKKDDGPQKIQFTLSVQEDFGYFNNALQWVVEPGTYDIFVAKSSDDEATAFEVTLT